MSYKQIKGSYSFLTIPMILIMGMVIGWPLIQTFIFSFTDADLLGITKPGFTGLNNFLDAF